jgi:surface polysaccharide O-acyltransferase-like enzyme
LTEPAGTGTATPAVVSRPSRRDIALLRVLAILGVMMIHVSGLTSGNARLRGTTVWWTAEILNQGSRFCVPLFVMVSGALVLKPGSTEPARAFFRKRLDRLIPALVVWHLVYIVFNAVVLEWPSGFHDIFTRVLTGRTYTALYFFWLVLGLYLLTPALRKVLDGLTQPALLRVGLALTALTCLWATTVSYVGSESTVDVRSTPTVFTYWVPYVGYYVLGAALARVQLPRRTGVVALAAVAAASAGSIWIGSGSAPRWVGIALPTGYQGWFVAVATAGLFLAAVALLPTRDRTTPWQRFVDVLGGLTLGVFACHLLVLYALQHSGVLTVVRGASRLIELAYLSVGTVVLSFALAWLLSQVPGLRRLV